MPMTLLFVLVAIGVVVGVGLATAGHLGQLPEVEPDHRPDLVRGEPSFDVVFRGYRMDEVDEAISSLQQQVRDLQNPASP